MSDLWFKNLFFFLKDIIFTNLVSNFEYWTFKFLNYRSGFSLPLKCHKSKFRYPEKATKNWKNLPLRKSFIFEKVGYFFKFFGLLTISELYYHKSLMKAEYIQPQISILLQSGTFHYSQKKRITTRIISFQEWKSIRKQRQNIGSGWWSWWQWFRWRIQW